MTPIMSTAPPSPNPLAGVQVPKGEIYSLTSIRGLAASWVVLFHCSRALFMVLPGLVFLKPLIDAGEFAVPLFFVLSGYVLGLRYLGKLGTPSIHAVLRFWGLRLGRIYPVHLVTLVVSLGPLIKHGWPTDPGHTRAAFIENCLLIQAWVTHYRDTWNYPSWSISSEWCAYLLFPPVAFALSRIHRKWAPALLIAAGALSATVYAFEQSLLFKGLIVVVPTFIGGVILAIAYPPSTSMRAWRWAEAGLLAAIVLPFLVQREPVLAALYLVLFFALVGTLGAAGNRCSAFWRHPALIYLGDISYSLYMTHAITLTVLTLCFPPRTLRAATLAVRSGAMLGYLAGFVVVAIGTYYAVERPMRGWSRRLAGSRAAINTLSADGPPNIGAA